MPEGARPSRAHESRTARSAASAAASDAANRSTTRWTKRVPVNRDGSGDETAKWPIRPIASARHATRYPRAAHSPSTSPSKNWCGPASNAMISPDWSVTIRPTSRKTAPAPGTVTL